MIEISVTGPVQRSSRHREEIPAIDGAQDEAVIETAELELIRTITTPHADLDYYLDDDPLEIAHQLKRGDMSDWRLVDADTWTIEIDALYSDLIASAQLTAEQANESVVDTLTRWQTSDRLPDQPVAGALETVEAMIEDGYGEWIGECPENDANA